MMKKVSYVEFAINETPYCFWDLDPYRQSLDFINRIDPRYFEHVADLHGQFLDGDEKQYAAAALRIAYSHGLESLFALLCATAQAPDCIIGWLLKYKNQELFEVVRKINRRESIYSKLPDKPVTWEYLSNLVFAGLNTGDPEKDSLTRNSFALLWERFASDFLDEKLGYEYNSIKHGLRARMGGFYLSIGKEDVPGVPAPPERMQVVANSVFGSSFFIPLRLHDSRNFSVIHQGLNWNPEKYIYALKLISASINNVIASLKIFYGVPANQVEFIWFKDDSAYEEPWKQNTGITSMAMSPPFTENDVSPLSKEDILSVYDEKKEEDGGDDNADS